MKRKNSALGMWIISIGYTCLMSLCLLLMVGSSVAISFAGLSRIVGLVIAGLGLLGSVGLFALGGAAIVSAVTVFCMRRFAKPAQTAAQGAADDAAASPDSKS